MNPISSILLALAVVSFAYSFSGRCASILKGNDISYGVYIYHMVIFNVLVHTGIVHQASALLLGYAILIPTALLSWRCVEKPAMRWKAYSVKRPGQEHLRRA